MERIQNGGPRLIRPADLDRMQDTKTRVRDPRPRALDCATAIAFVQICAASRTQPAAILAAQRPRRQREQHLFANQWGQIDLFSLVERKLEVLRPQVAVAIVTDR